VKSEGAVAPLIRALRDSEWKVRISAAEALGNYRAFAKRIVPVLLLSLRDDNVGVSHSSIAALGKLGRDSAEAAVSLQELLADPDPTTRARAAAALVHFGKADESAIGPLLTALNSDAANARSAAPALEQLARKFPDKMAEALREAVDQDQDPLKPNFFQFIRNAKLQNDGLFLGLARAYDRGIGKNRGAVLSTLVETDKTGDRALLILKKAFEDPDPAVRRAAIASASRLAARLELFKPQLLAALNDEVLDNRIVAVQAVKQLAQRLPEALPKMVVLSGDPDLAVRGSALAALGFFPNDFDAVIGILQANMEDPEIAIRTACLESLSRLAAFRPTAVVPILERAYASETYPSNRQTIAVNLYRFGGKMTEEMASFEATGSKRLRPGEEIGGFR